jgi:glycosidase
VIPLGGESHPLADVKFSETPAKWTGNGSRLPQPSANDWYDTVKLNFGVRPDGGADFPRLPNEYKHKDVNQHAQFWAEQEIPDTWLKFKHIAHFWLNKGVDGFRYDMAEMVPIEFWSFLNSSIKSTHHHAFTLAEVYNPARYRDFIHIGLMDHLYDKVEFYDALKGIMQQTAGTDKLELVQAGLQDIEAHMLHFLENHDEQRIASPEFAKDAAWGKPAMVVAALVSRSPTMLYFGQEVGEDGSEVAGFGKPSRTSIFDYIGVPAHQRWMNGGRFDGGQLNEKETKLRAFYQTVLRLSATHPAMAGEYVSLHSVNCWHQSDYDNSQFAFARWIDSNVLIVVSSFHATDSKYYELLLPNELIAHIGLQGYGLQDRGLEQQNLVNLVDRQYNVLDKLTQQQFVLQVSQGQGRIALTINPRSSLILEVKYD